MHRSASSKRDNSDAEFLLPNEQVQAMGSVPQYIQHNADMDLLPVQNLFDDTKSEQYVDGGGGIECLDSNVENGVVNILPANIEQ